MKFTFNNGFYLFAEKSLYKFIVLKTCNYNNLMKGTAFGILWQDFPQNQAK